MAEEKSNELKVDSYDDLSDEEEESVVNSQDLREKAHTLAYKFKNHKIIECIGKVSATFMDKYNNKYITVGTATAYKTENGITNLITAAHNVRLTRYHCNACSQMNACRACSNCTDSNSVRVILRADKLSFEIRNLSTGAQERKYDCNVDDIYLDDLSYANYPRPSGTFDVAVLQIKDDGYFAEKTKNIVIVSAVLLNKFQSHKLPYFIFGYPHSVDKEKDKQREEMWGAASIKDNYSLKENLNSDLYLTQAEIDTSKGQSGAPVFSLHNEYALIFALHVGGADSYNIATLLKQHMVVEDAAEMKELDEVIKASIHIKPFEKSVFQVEFGDVDGLEKKKHQSNHKKNKRIDQNESKESGKRKANRLPAQKITAIIKNGLAESFGVDALRVAPAMNTKFDIPVNIETGAVLNALRESKISILEFIDFVPGILYTKHKNAKISVYNNAIQLFNMKLKNLKEIEMELLPKTKQLQQQEDKINNKTFQIERDCTNSKIIVCIGPVGYGKSLVCNRLVGHGDDIEVDDMCDLSESKKSMFKVGDGLNSVTKDLIKKTRDVLIYQNTNKNAKLFTAMRLSVVDTPGAFDADGNDLDIQNLMKEFFHFCCGINMFCIFFKFGLRFDANYKKLLKIYDDFWGEKFWQHCVIFITNCDMDS
eukprot:417118_1